MAQLPGVEGVVPATVPSARLRPLCSITKQVYRVPFRNPLPPLGPPPRPAGEGVQPEGAQFTDGPMWSQAVPESARVPTCCLLPRAPRGLLPVHGPSALSRVCSRHGPHGPQGLRAPKSLQQHHTRSSKAHLKLMVITSRGFIAPESLVATPRRPGRRYFTIKDATLGIYRR